MIKICFDYWRWKPKSRNNLCPTGAHFKFGQCHCSIIVMSTSNEFRLQCGANSGTPSAPPHLSGTCCSSVRGDVTRSNRNSYSGVGVPSSSSPVCAPLVSSSLSLNSKDEQQHHHHHHATTVANSPSRICSTSAQNPATCSGSSAFFVTVFWKRAD